MAEHGLLMRGRNEEDEGWREEGGKNGPGKMILVPYGKSKDR